MRRCGPRSPKGPRGRRPPRARRTGSLAYLPGPRRRSRALWRRVDQQCAREQTSWWTSRLGRGRRERLRVREGRGNGRRRGSEKLEEVERLKGPTCVSPFLFDCCWYSVTADRSSLQLKIGENVLMCLFSYSRLCRQANSYSLPVLTCACAGLSGTLLVPLVEVHEVRKSGAPAASPAYRRAGASCRCKPQLKLNILASPLSWATRSRYCAPHTLRKRS